MIHLLPCPKAYSTDQDKAISPQETLTRVRSKLESLEISILAETRRIDVNRLGIPVFVSVCGADARSVMPTRKQMGKGASLPQAEASALMELMERYGFFTFWKRMPQMVRATWSEAKERFSNNLIDIQEVIAACHDTISPEQAERLLNLRTWLFFPATRIIDNATIYVPLDLFKQLGEFNGSSAGNTDVESILQGACELVERHVCCLADAAATPLPTISTSHEHIHDPILAGLLRKFQDNGITVLLKDFSLGMPVPTVAAIAMDASTFPATSEIVYTAGTAASPAKAAIRALTEVAQLAGDFCTNACYEASGLPKYAAVKEIQWLQQGPVVHLNTLPNLESDDILQELLTLAANLRQKGFSLYSIATTNPDTGVPSHYNIIPGFHFRERDKNASLGLFIGRMITEEADAATATAALQVLAEVYPNAHFVPFFKGMLAMRTEDFALARQWFSVAEPLQPENDAKALTAFYHAYTHTLQNEWQLALPGLNRAATLCPDMKEYLNLRGVCLFKLERYAEAAADFQDILSRLDKGSIMDIQNLGMCHKRMNNKDEARHYLTAALTLDPTLAAAQEALREYEQ